MSGFLAAKIGSGLSKGLNASTFLNEINTTLKNAGMAIGAILIALAALKIIVAMADENVAERNKAAMLFGVGLVFVSINTVLTNIIGTGITSNTTVNSVVKSILDLIGAIGNWGGIIMIAIGAFSYMLAITNEDPAQQTKSTMTLFAGLGFILMGTLCDKLKNVVGSNIVSNYKTPIIDMIKAIGIRGGAILVVAGIFKLVFAMRTEDSKARTDAIKLLAIGIGLVSFGSVLVALGLTTTANDNF